MTEREWLEATDPESMLGWLPQSESASRLPRKPAGRNRDYFGSRLRS
jgi:hypothetical protein